jgi:hypothetical protein
MAEPLALFAEKTLRKRGVELILEDRLVAATSEKAILKSGVRDPLQDHYLYRAVTLRFPSSRS